MKITPNMLKITPETQHPAKSASSASMPKLVKTQQPFSMAASPKPATPTQSAGPASAEKPLTPPADIPLPPSVVEAAAQAASPSRPVPKSQTKTSVFPREEVVHSVAPMPTAEPQVAKPASGQAAPQPAAETTPYEEVRVPPTLTLPSTSLSTHGPKFGVKSALCDMCQKAVSKEELEMVRGQRLCSECREKMSKAMMRPTAPPSPESPDAAPSPAGSGRIPAIPRPDSGRATARPTAKDSGIANLTSLKRWPDVTLTDEEDSYREMWKKNSSNISTPAPIKEKSYRLEGNAFTTPLIPGLIFIAAGVVLMVIDNLAARITGAPFVLGGILLAVRGLDGRAVLRCDPKAFWKDAFISSTRIYWPVVRTVEITESKLPSFLGNLMSSIVLEIVTSDIKTHQVSIPVYFKKMTMPLREFDALKKQLATIITMYGAKLR
jgi:hypothetical protein